MKTRLIVLAGVLLALALIVAGCGDDDDASTTALTKAQFVKQGNAICKAGNEELESEFEQFAKEKDIKKEPTEAQFAEAAEEFFVPSVSRQISEVRDLGAPEGEEEAVEAFLDNAEAEVEEIEDDPTLLSEDSFKGVNEEARALGLAACAE